jgi:hypothetical protein
MRHELFYAVAVICHLIALRGIGIWHLHCGIWHLRYCGIWQLRARETEAVAGELGIEHVVALAPGVDVLLGLVCRNFETASLEVGDFGAAKMRFDEGEERAARAAPVCSRPTPSPTGRASRGARPNCS